MSETIVASIGTTHPWNIAGTGLDARVAAEYGLRHVTAVAGVSAQDDRTVRAVLPIPGHVLKSQLESLPPGIAAYRVGALISSENIRVVTDFLGKSDAQVVVDPVLSATTGEALWTTAAYVDDLRDRLLRSPVIVTPNLEEAAMLLRLTKPLRDPQAMLVAAHQLVEHGARAALVKGGHLHDAAADVLATADRDRVFTAERLDSEMRGTGCLLAMSLACELALGEELFAAAESARDYVRKKFQAGARFGALQTAF